QIVYEPEGVKAPSFLNHASIMPSGEKLPNKRAEEARVKDPLLQLIRDMHEEFHAKSHSYDEGFMNHLIKTRVMPKAVNINGVRTLIESGDLSLAEFEKTLRSYFESNK